MGRGGRRHGRRVAPDLPHVIAAGQRVRIISEAKTAVVVLGYGSHVVVEIDGSGAPRRIPRSDIELVEGAD